jgi:hypothetical protein
VLTGVEAGGRGLLRLLSCVVRHALPLEEIKQSTFDHVPLHIRPTMLVVLVHPSTCNLFTSSNRPLSYLANRNGLTDRCCAKAAYAGANFGVSASDGFLNINCNVLNEKIFFINRQEAEEIAAHFQPKLLDYRFKYLANVRDAEFGVETLPTSLRIRANALGSCIIDTPDLQADIGRLLESQGEELRENRKLDRNYVAIQALFEFCHSETGDARLGVSEIATAATRILADRGETIEFEAKKMGSQLRLFGLHAKRDSKGFAIQLTVDERRRIHRLVRDHQVGDSESALPGCPLCVETQSSQNRRSNP